VAKDCGANKRDATVKNADVASVPRRGKCWDANIVSLVHQIFGQDREVGIIYGRGHRGEKRKELYRI
jgi:hypothetical protein